MALRFFYRVRSKSAVTAPPNGVLHVTAPHLDSELVCVVPVIENHHLITLYCGGWFLSIVPRPGKRFCARKNCIQLQCLIQIGVTLWQRQWMMQETLNQPPSISRSHRSKALPFAIAILFGTTDKTTSRYSKKGLTALCCCMILSLADMNW